MRWKKNTLGFLISFGLAALGPSWSSDPQERASQAFSCAVLDQERVLFESQAAQDVRAQIESQRAAFQKEIDQQEKALRQEEDALKTAQPTLSEEAFLERRTAFETRVGEVHKKVALRRAQLEHAFHKAREEIVGAMNKIVAQLSQETGTTLVLPKGAVLYALDSLDITQEVLSKLNHTLPTIKIEHMTQEDLHD